MNNLALILGIVFVIGVILMFVKYQHRMGIFNNVEQLRQVTDEIFEEAAKSPISQNRYIRGLKEHLHVNEKMALKLIGRARMENIIRVEGKDVVKA